MEVSSNMEEMSLTLYHGTNSEHLDRMYKEGLNSPYLTRVRGLAWYYAEAAEGDGVPIVLELKVSRNTLVVDRPSIDEPVGFGKSRSEMLERRVGRAFALLPKGANPGYAFSLALVGTCRSSANVPGTNIKRVFQTNTGREYGI